MFREAGGEMAEWHSLIPRGALAPVRVIFL
jgi:hypothetical protein